MGDVTKPSADVERDSILLLWDVIPSQPFYRPGKPVEFGSFLDHNRSPLGGRVQLPHGCVDLHLALLEDFFFPHLGPGFRGMTEHLRKGFRTLALDRHSAV